MSHVHRLPIWFRAVGAVTGVGAACLAARLVYEQTVLTWAEGPQMIGFSLAHSGLILILLPCAVLLSAWVVVLVAWSALARWYGARLSASRWVAVALASAVVATPFVPYGTWQRLFASRLAEGPLAAEHLVYAAAAGDFATVRALLNRGVNVDVRNGDGATALYGAAVVGHVPMIEYLLSEGADLNARDSVGQSAVEGARAMDHSDAVQLLLAHGAR